MDTRNSCAPEIPARIFLRLLYHHRRVRFKKQNLALRTEAEVDAPIIQTDRCRQSFQCSHPSVAHHSSHIGQELRLLRTMIGALRHVSAEVVNLPVIRDGEVEW